MTNNHQDLSKFGDNEPSDLFVGIGKLVSLHNHIHYGIPIPDEFQDDPCILHQSDIETLYDLIHDEVRCIQKQGVHHVVIQKSPTKVIVVHTVDLKPVFYETVITSGDNLDLETSHAKLMDILYYLKNLK